MPNILDANGLQTMSQPELLEFWTTQIQTIYGADVNLDSDTPDGQWININIQSQIDMLNLLTNIYNSFDPDNANGVVLDQRVAINGIQRQQGTYTITPVTIVNTQSVNLIGLDEVDEDDPDLYTVADNAGNKWFLQVSQIGLSSGTHSFNFRAAIPGAQLTIPNTITVPVTVVLGVSSINNPSTYSILGINEETDAQLKVRRQQSVSLASQGYYAALYAALKNISGVMSAFINENDSDITDADGTPSHSIWVIVAGSGAAASIAQAIYTKRNAGCGMRGVQTYTITQADGSPFVVRWDDTVNEDLFIIFTATSINGTVAPNIDGIRTGLPTSYVPAVFAEVDINGLATQVQVIDPNTLVTNAGFSSGVIQTINISVVPDNGNFTLNYSGNSSATIGSSDSISTIQSKVQAITGLSAATVTGSLATKTLVFNLASVGGPTGLLTVSNSSLAAGPTLATYTYDEGLTSTLLPATKQDQFLVSAANIIILPMQLKPFTSTIPVSTTQQMNAYGGYGTYTYSITVNNSGGSINATSGVFTGGTTSGATDTIKAVDSMGNSATALVTVV